MQGQVDIDLRSAPVALLMLQEAQPQLVGALRQGASSGASAADPSRTRDGGEGWERAWLCLRGSENGNSLVVACRTTMLAKISLLLWRKRADGRYIDRGSSTRALRTANSRVLVAAVTLKNPWCGMSRVVVCNCHFHHLTAKRHKGFVTSHTQFWDELASTIVEHRVRILAGDFNMSLWVVAREMRQRGLQITIAAAFAWAEPGASEAKSDSCGIFLLGPVTSTRLLWGPSVFTSAIADEDRALPRFVAGQGYVLASYLPRGAEAVRAMEETFASEAVRARGQCLTEDWEVLPVAVQKNIKKELFLPRGVVVQGWRALALDALPG